MAEENKTPAAEETKPAEKEKQVEVRLLDNINGNKIGDVATFPESYLKRMTVNVDYLKDTSDKAYNAWLESQKKKA